MTINETVRNLIRTRYKARGVYIGDKDHRPTISIRMDRHEEFDVLREVFPTGNTTSNNMKQNRCRDFLLFDTDAIYVAQHILDDLIYGEWRSRVDHWSKSDER